MYFCKTNFSARRPPLLRDYKLFGQICQVDIVNCKFFFVHILLWQGFPCVVQLEYLFTHKIKARPKPPLLNFCHLTDNGDQMNHHSYRHYYCQLYNDMTPKIQIWNILVKCVRKYMTSYGTSHLPISRAVKLNIARGATDPGYCFYNLSNSSWVISPA